MVDNWEIIRTRWPSFQRSGSAAFWYCGFKSSLGHGCLFLVRVMCCQAEVSATGRSVVHRSPSKCVYVIECDQRRQQLLHQK
jgi:hypothetical protein